MNRIPYRELRNSKAAELKEMIPLTVDVLGEDYILVKAADVVVIGDMHPMAQKNFKALENRIRTAMGTPMVTAKDFFGESPREEEKVAVEA